MMALILSSNLVRISSCHSTEEEKSSSPNKLFLILKLTAQIAFLIFILGFQKPINQKRSKSKSFLLK